MLAHAPALVVGEPTQVQGQESVIEYRLTAPALKPADRHREGAEDRNLAFTCLGSGESRFVPDGALESTRFAGVFHSEGRWRQRRALGHALHPSYL